MGRAAEVPQNGLRLRGGPMGNAVVTQSAAVMSGLRTSRPPAVSNWTLPGVIPAA